MRTTEEVYSYKSAEPGGAAVHYSCRQFVLDMDWWRATFPQAKWSDHELYKMMLGLGTIARMQGGGFDAKPFVGSVKDFEVRWTKSIEDCRNQPDKRLVDVLQPEGRLAQALSAQLAKSH